MVSSKSPLRYPAMPGMLRKSTAFVPRYQKFESISLQRTGSRLLGFSRQFLVLIDQRTKMLFDSRRGGFRLECPESCRGAKIFGRMLLNWLIQIFIKIGHAGAPFSLSRKCGYRKKVTSQQRLVGRHHRGSQAEGGWYRGAQLCFITGPHDERKDRLIDHQCQAEGRHQAGGSASRSGMALPAARASDKLASTMSFNSFFAVR